MLQPACELLYDRLYGTSSVRIINTYWRAVVFHFSYYFTCIKIHFTVALTDTAIDNTVCFAVPRGIKCIITVVHGRACNKNQRKRRNTVQFNNAAIFFLFNGTAKSGRYRCVVHSRNTGRMPELIYWWLN